MNCNHEGCVVNVDTGAKVGRCTRCGGDVVFPSLPAQQKDWVRWDRSKPLPVGVLFPVVLVDLSWGFATPSRFYRDGVIAYWPDPLNTYTAK